MRSRKGTRTKPGRTAPEVDQRPGDDADDDRPDAVQGPRDDRRRREAGVRPGKAEHDQHRRKNEEAAGQHQSRDARSLVPQQNGELG